MASKMGGYEESEAPDTGAVFMAGFIVGFLFCFGLVLIITLP